MSTAARKERVGRPELTSFRNSRESERKYTGSTFETR
jgi:hypothetical protein